MTWGQTLAICAAILALEYGISKAAEFLGRKIEERGCELQAAVWEITHKLHDLNMQEQISNLQSAVWSIAHELDRRNKEVPKQK